MLMFPCKNGDFPLQHVNTFHHCLKHGWGVFKESRQSIRITAPIDTVGPNWVRTWFSSVS